VGEGERERDTHARARARTSIMFSAQMHMLKCIFIHVQNMISVYAPWHTMCTINVVQMCAFACALTHNTVHTHSFIYMYR
jgi:hypothetical protein